MSTTTNQPTTTSPSQASASPLDTLSGKAGPLVGQAKQFAKDRPFATAALAGVVGLALLNTLRGR